MAFLDNAPYTINDVKSKLSKYIGHKLILNYNLGRNKYEEFEAIIKKLYNYIFIVELINRETPTLKSFTYSDVITKTLKFKKNS